MHLRNFDPAAFLRDSWQQQPRLIRNPWAAWANPLSPDELAGLACEPGVEARLIRRTPDAVATEHGPFDEARFAELDRQPWTLLVQAVDHQVPAVAALIDAFRFIPNWRIDDVMVSYAVDQGGVGPHYDHYDVFLIQGLGRRRWQVGAQCDAGTPLQPHDDLRLLADFEATAEWVLDPGDILYIPPGFAHDGVALGDDCMTYSIGFRAPARSELIAGWCDAVLADLDDDDRYADPGLALADNPGEVSAAALDRLHAMVTARLGDRAAFARWFGRETSQRKYPEIDWSPDAPTAAAEVRQRIARGDRIERNPASRFLFIAEADDAVQLCIDGESYACTGSAADFARQLCASAVFAVDAAAMSAPVTDLLTALINQGSLRLAGLD